MEINLTEFDTSIARRSDKDKDKTKAWGKGIIPDRIHVFIGRRGSGEFQEDHVVRGGHAPLPLPLLPKRLWRHEAGSLSHYLVAILPQGGTQGCSGCTPDLRGEGEGGAPPSHNTPPLRGAA